MEPEFRLKDFTDIYALCARRADSFCLIGDHFCQIFRGRDVVSVCLTLIACYQECSSLLFVTQRLIIVYLIYRLKDIGQFDDEQPDGCELSEIRNHPFLLIFVKIYADYRANVDASPAIDASNNAGNVILPLLAGFPPITPQEAQFIGRILTEPVIALKLLFRMSPANVADKAVSNTVIDITDQLNFVESQLERFRVFGRENVQENIDSKGSNTNMNQSKLNHYARIVYSLVPPPFVRIDPSMMSPCPDEFRFIYPSLIAPEPVVDDWLKDEEWKQEKMRPLEKTQSSAKLLLRSSAPSSPAGARKRPTAETSSGGATAGGYGASPILDAILLQSAKSSGLNNFNKSLGSRPSASPPKVFETVIGRELLMRVDAAQEIDTSAASELAKFMSRDKAVDCLTKLINNGRTTSGLSKADVGRLLHTVADDPEIFSGVTVGDSFTDIVEFYPDLAAELMLYELKHDSPLLEKHFDALLGLQFSVQSLVTVNKFISTCENKQLEIPADFLNLFITHCMESCEQKNDANALMAHRLVRMVCVFFTTLIRLKSFDSKPRLTEMQNFALIFLTLKEASTLYQTILQIE